MWTQTKKNRESVCYKQDIKKNLNARDLLQYGSHQGKHSQKFLTRLDCTTTGAIVKG